MVRQISTFVPLCKAYYCLFFLPGVVNSQLIVYDTTNLCVVDASILPFQISAHLSSTVYGVAEKAADLIKNRNH